MKCVYCKAAIILGSVAIGSWVLGFIRGLTPEEDCGLNSVRSIIVTAENVSVMYSKRDKTMYVEPYRLGAEK